MHRRDVLRAWIATPLARWLRPWLPTALRGSASGGANAADLYRGAFEWAESLGPEQLKPLQNAVTVAIDDPNVVALIQQARPVLRAIRKAATINPCRWGIETVTSDDLGKGYLDVCNLSVIRVACLSARGHAESGQHRDALDDAFAGLKLAHRVGTGGFLFARVLECGGEVTAFQALARILPGLERRALEDLSRRLAVLPPPEPASAAIGPESRFIRGSLATKLMAIGPVVEGDQWAELGLDDDEAEALKWLTGGDREKLLAHLEATGPAFAELARRLDLPRPGCRTALDEFVRAEQSNHPIAAGLVENAWGVRHVVDRMRALRSMLKAGVALVREGETAFRAQPDPFGTGAFGLEHRGKGYLIRSALNDAGKPDVSLEIGDTA